MPPGEESIARPEAASPRPEPVSSSGASHRHAFILCRESDPAPCGLTGAIAGIGNFDGVHRGHRALLDTVRAEAAATLPPRPAVALTFEPHPRAFLAPELPIFRLTGPEAKVTVLSRLGLDGVIVRRFDAALAGMSAESFVQGLLKDQLGLSGVVIGHDFHFGRGREGNPHMLAALCAAAGLSCRIVAAVSPSEGAPPISSSAIRAALARGDLAGANALLGYRWLVLGAVRHGDKRGRTLGYPTANIALDACGLAHGIYAVRARLPDGSLREGVASYGRRPTFDDGAPLLEVNLFAFSGDLYGQTLAVEFLAHLRPEIRFESVPALVERMDRDAAEARLVAATDRTPSMLG